VYVAPAHRRNQRGLRDVVLGRKNHYGSRSQRGTDVAALFYRFIESAKLCGVEPKAYLLRATHAALGTPGPSRSPASFCPPDVDLQAGLPAACLLRCGEARGLTIMQGALDDNVLPAVQEKFAATYQVAGGVCELTVFEGSEHEWVAKPGPQTDRAREMVKAFIARQLKA
jgi:prolyl oligopeptidase family protein